MTVYILIIIVLIFALIGVAETIKNIVFFITSQCSKDAVVILPIKGHNEKAEYMIRGIFERSRWESETGVKTFIVLDCGMDCETRQICEKFCSEHSGMRVCDEADIDKILRSIDLK